MSYIRFNHVFTGLIVLSFLSAFIFSPTPGDRARAQVQNIFAPVALPANRLSSLIANRVSPIVPRDDGSPRIARSSAQLVIENNQLRIELANLEDRLKQLQQREAQWAKLGEIRPLCTLFDVVGVDSGPRESLVLLASSMDRVEPMMPVLYTSGIAGRISRAGVGGAQVLLITDTQSHVEAVFGRFVKSSEQATPRWQLLSIDPRLIVGDGHGGMSSEIETQIIQDAGLQKDDWVVLRDRDWPDVLRDYRLGRIDRIIASRSPGFSHVMILPDAPLTRLREVMVMNKEKG